MDTSLVVVDSTILLYSNLKTSDKEIHAILKERPEYGRYGNIFSFSVLYERS